MVLTPVSATDFWANVTVPEVLWAGQPDNGTLMVHNAGKTDWFTITVIADWVKIEPWAIKILRGTSANITLHIVPDIDAKPGTYSYPLTVTRLSDNAKFERDLLITVRQRTAGEVEMSLSCENCTDKIKLSATVKNTGTRVLAGVLVLAIDTIEKENIFSDLAVDGQTTIAEDFELSGLRPGNYTARAVLRDAAGRTLDSASGSFFIPVVEKIAYERIAESSIFGLFVTLRAKNLGNVPAEARLQSELLGVWWALYAGPAPASLQDNRVTFAVSLAPFETFELKYTEIYWPVPVLLLALAALAAIATYRLFAVVTVRKKTSRPTAAIGRDIVISLCIKNARRTLEKAILRDFIPPAFSLAGRFETARPIARKGPNGIELIWKIGRLDPGEERVLNYKIRPVLEISSITLPSARIRGLLAGREIVRHSNSVTLVGIGKKPRKLLIRIEK
jgi:hypothetical protein